MVEEAPAQKHSLIRHLAARILINAITSFPASAAKNRFQMACAVSSSPRAAVCTARAKAARREKARIMTAKSRFNFFRRKRQPKGFFVTACLHYYLLRSTENANTASWFLLNRYAGE